MGSTTVRVSHGFGAWHARFLGQLPRLYYFMAAMMQTNRGMLFKTGGVYNGHDKWPKLKLRDGQPLMDRKTLFQSIGPISKRDAGVRPKMNEGTIVKISPDKVTIGTSLA